MPKCDDDLARPAIVDLTELKEGSEEPARCTIVFCLARLDNRQELAELLSIDLEISNAALILAAYQRFGTDCADRLIGDFSFAIRDPAKGFVYVARDFMGCQPSYFSTDGARFAIAEHMEQLLALDGISRKPDEPFIAASLTHAFAHPERTFFEAVRKTPPAHWLTVDRSGASAQKYWAPEDINQRTWTDHEQCLVEFRDIYQQAVRDRLPDTGATGVHVSGGLDCSSVAVLAAEELKIRGKDAPVALTWYSPPEPDLPEVEQEEYDRVIAVCDAIGIAPTYTVPTKDSVMATLARDHMVRPICNASYNEAPVLTEAEARGVTTILSGFGGDEAASFSGRGYLQQLAMSGRWLTLRKFAKAAGTGTLRFCFGFLFIGFTHSVLSDENLRSIRRTRYGHHTPVWQVAMKVGAGFFGILMSAKGHREGQSDPDKQPYIDPDFLQRTEPLPRLRPARYTSVKSAQCQLLQWRSLVARIESWAADGALHGIKYAYPLLDRRLIEFVLSLPDHVFCDDEWDRLFFRQAMAPFLPPEVCQQRTKSDPARAEPLIEALKASFIEIGDQERSRDTQSEKAQYLDMPRLIEDLAAPRIQNRTAMGRLVMAMDFFGTGAAGK